MPFAVVLPLVFHAKHMSHHVTAYRDNSEASLPSCIPSTCPTCDPHTSFSGMMYLHISRHSLASCRFRRPTCREPMSAKRLLRVPDSWCCFSAQHAPSSQVLSPRHIQKPKEQAIRDTRLQARWNTFPLLKPPAFSACIRMPVDLSGQARKGGRQSGPGWIARSPSAPPADGWGHPPRHLRGPAESLAQTRY